MYEGGSELKVYVVTAGDYSDYHIEAIFTNETVANQYANLDSDRNVEEYEVDVESVSADPTKLVYFVTYDFETDTIKTLCLTSGNSRGDDFVYEYQTVFGFYVSPSETLNNSVRMFGMHSDWIKRIAQDRFYMYCDAHETSRHELIQKKEERSERFLRQYKMYSTSIPSYDDGMFNPYWHADRRMPELMKKYNEEHGTFPDADMLRKLYDEQVQEVKYKHEHDELR